MAQHTITINLPTLIYARDYHEFKPAQELLKQFIPKVKVTEIGMAGSEYCAAVHLNKTELKEAKEILEIEE